MSPEVHVVTGLPCAGKSTLCRELATVLGGTPIVVGDLIRAARDSTPGTSHHSQDAFDGHKQYSADWIASLIAPRLAVARSPVVVDGAVPLDSVLPRIGVDVTSLLLLQVSDEERYRRFQKRRSSLTRADDIEQRFHRRSRFHQSTLPQMQLLAPPDSTFEITGDGSVPAVLRQALSAVTTARHFSCRPPVVDIRSFNVKLPTTSIVDLADQASRQQCVVRSDNAYRTSASADPILLVKPFKHLRPAMLSAVLDKFNAAGYGATGAAVWPCTAIEAAKAMPVHLDLHYTHARWGLLAGDEQLTRAAGKARPSYELLSSTRSPQALSTWWHSPPLPRKLARCLWLKDDDDFGRVINGHIPALVNSWHYSDSFVAAVRLTRRRRAVTWRDLRTEVLGTAEPAQAAPNSVRGAAHAGLLPDAGPVSLAENLVHLSAGPLEAIRERWLWLGCDEKGTALIDHPIPSGGWQYAMTENVDSL